MIPKLNVFPAARYVVLFLCLTANGFATDVSGDPPAASLSIHEVFGKGEGKLEASESLVIEKNATIEVGSEELVIQPEDDQSNSIVSIGVPMTFPLTIDIRMRVEIPKEDGAMLEFQAFQKEPNGMTWFTFSPTQVWCRGEGEERKTIPADLETMATYRFIYIGDGTARLVVPETGDQLEMALIPSETPFGANVLRFNFQKARIYIQEIKIYESVPGQTP